MIHTVHLLIPRSKDTSRTTMDIAREVTLDYASPEPFDRRRPYDMPIKRRFSNTIWLPECHPVCQQKGEQVHLTMGSGQLNDDCSLAVSIDLCAAYYELCHCIPSDMRDIGFRSWLDADHDTPLERLPGGCKQFMRYAQNKGTTEEMAQRLLCDWTNSERAEARDHLDLLQKFIMQERAPFLLSPAQIVRVLRLYLWALEATWHCLDIERATVKGIDICYHWRIPGLRNFMPGLIADFARKAGRGVRMDENWVEELDKRGRFLRGAYMLSEDGRLDGDILRLRFRLRGHRARDLGILDMSALFTDSAYEQTLLVEPLVGELQRQVASVRLCPCLNEVDLVNSGSIHALRKLIMFHTPQLQPDYLEHKLRFARNHHEALRKEIHRLDAHPVQMLTAERLRVPDADRLTELFANKPPGPIYYVSDISVRHKTVVVVESTRHTM